MRFKDKVVLVTGATRNTGVSIAALFIREGAKVCINGCTEKGLQKGASELNRAGLKNFDQFIGDISDIVQVEKMFQLIKEKYGRLDILVNNAANQGVGMKFDTMKPDDFLQVLKVNLLGTFQVSQQAVRIMVEQKSKGTIINLGSNVSKRAIHDRIAYVTSKGGIDALTKAMATDLGSKGIRVNMVAPGYIYTDRWDELSPEVKKRRRSNIPLGSEASGEDISQAVAFLASDAAKNITGERLVVDGGCSAQHLPLDIDL
ncbi:SDR family NAD(P)-dependent oxidoreductase [Kriegella aquimaris]|uniref:3-oxoacyl-[acyl-carrier protein] reductase n=1 Tax=Kriegella aquimaris TaxID=192904 RepID=A0A1G9TPH3_9FLAO|nr:SDR family oxidoreductase [Kriegella aquimaris]SDM49552.1 3-oxoacyl-[acyl-carrier protein] reductase [Kriegella aquimaris]